MAEAGAEDHRRRSAIFKREKRKKMIWGFGFENFEEKLMPRTRQLHHSFTPTHRYIIDDIFHIPDIYILLNKENRAVKCYILHLQLCRAVCYVLPLPSFPHNFGRNVKKVKKETIIPDPDYRIPIVLLGAAGGFVYLDNLAAAVPFGLLGLLLLVQATRVRFVFDREALEVKIGDQLEESGENAFVGGKNRWKYSTFVNWELWWPNFPILVYFKERQTKPDGQIHFFPVIFNGKQLYDAMVERCGPSKTSGKN